MKAILFSFIIFALAGLTSCIEIVDDLTINNDGSGKLNYTINLSSSKVKIGSILALDSLNGKKVPSLDEIKTKIKNISNRLEAQEGITSVSETSDFNNYIFKFSINFNSIEELQKGIKTVLSKELNNNLDIINSPDWISFSQKKLTKTIPAIILNKAIELNEDEKNGLLESKYTSIIRFESDIKTNKNPLGKISKNKKAYMIQSDIYSLIQNRTKLNETISL